MSNLALTNRSGQSINNWQNWTPPKHNYHWKEGRSAMELAKSWFVSGTPQCPAEIQTLLSTSPHIANIQFEEGRPEFVTSLPERGEGRNHDLMLKGRTSSQPLVVCVEAKVDEPFGERIGEYWQKAKARQYRTRAPERIQSLLEIVFGRNASPNLQPWSDLRYQLLTGIAGTLLEAANTQVPLAVFVVHEFQTPVAKIQLLGRNAEDYAKFVEVLFSIPTVSTGQMYGPLQFQPNHYLLRPVELLVGKATCQV